MKKIRSFSLFLALFLLFSFTSCVAESGEITRENYSTLNTEVIAQETTVAEEDTAKETETNEETTSPMIDFGGITVITPGIAETTEPVTTSEPEVTTVPEPETTPEPEVTTEPEPETTPEPEETTEPGYSEYDPAPDFIVFDAKGNPVRLSDMKGKPVVLNFWASWCPPCKAEMPDFDKVSRELDGEVVFMMVNVWDTQSAAEAIIDSMGYTFPVYFDLLEDAVSKYGIESIPQTYFIDKWGGLVAYGVGALSEADLRYGISMIYN